MRGLFVVLLITAFAASANAEPSLVGQWKSDANLSMRFNSERSKLENKTTLFLSQLMGHLTITFTAKAVTFEMPTIETVTSEGQKSPFVGSRETHPYRVLGATSEAVAVKSVAPITGRDVITIYNFVGPDTMWVYSGGTDSMPSSHLREYFVRVKTGNVLKADAPKGSHP
jgi:hypothetical protein